MGITGTHTLLYSSEPEKLRAVLRDVLALPNIDIGHGWMIFALPPSELAVHPAEGPTFDSGTRHQFTLMCDNLTNTVQELKGKGIDVKTEPHEERWGVHVMLNLPGNCEVMLYEPRHPIAAGMSAAKKRPAVRQPAAASRSRQQTTTRSAAPGRRAKKASRRR